MARVELPESRLRSRKRRRRLRMGVLLGALLLLLASAVVAAAYIPALQVRAVAVSGAQTLSSSTVEAFVRDQLSGAYWYVFPKANILLYPKRAIAGSLLKNYPVLASADVHAGDFHTVAVNLVERAPRALWCDNDSCFFMDENGVVYGEAPTFSEPVYTTYRGALAGDPPAGGLPKQFLSSGEFQALSALVDAIGQKLPAETVADVTVDAEKDVRVRFVSGFTLIFALADQSGDVFERLSLALTAEPLAAHTLSDFEYLDLRFGDKLYYKLK